MGQKLLDLHYRPALNVGHEGDETLGILEDGGSKCPYMPFMHILGPGTHRYLKEARISNMGSSRTQIEKYRYLETFLLDINKAGCLHRPYLRIVVSHGERPTDLVTTRLEDRPPLLYGIVVRKGHWARLLYLPVTRALETLKPPAGREGFECLLEESIPVRNTTNEVANMDEVKVIVRKAPRFRAVLDLAKLFSVSMYWLNSLGGLVNRRTNNLRFGETHVG